MSLHPLALSWEIQRPLNGKTDDSEWLMEVAELRGRVLYAEGRRPQFLQGNGLCFDLDLFDRVAFHLLLRTSGRLIGCIRLVPVTKVQVCGAASLLGTENFERLLVRLGTTRERVGEVGRWVVAPEYAPFRMGLRLVAGIGTLARRLGLEKIVAVVGTHDGQAAALTRAGGRPASGFPPVRSYKYDDDLVVLTFDLLHSPASMEFLAADMARRLSLDPVKEVGEPSCVA